MLRLWGLHFRDAFRPPSFENPTLEFIISFSPPRKCCLLSSIGATPLSHHLYINILVNTGSLFLLYFAWEWLMALQERAGFPVTHF